MIEKGIGNRMDLKFSHEDPLFVHKFLEPRLIVTNHELAYQSMVN